MVGLPDDILKDVQDQLQQAMAILKQTQSRLAELPDGMDDSLAIAGAKKLVALAFSDLDFYSTRL